MTRGFVLEAFALLLVFKKKRVCCCEREKAMIENLHSPVTGEMRTH